MTIRVYYYRFDQNYDGWDLWLWPKGLDGAAYPLSGSVSLPDYPQDEMLYTDVVLEKLNVSELGFILRKNAWLARDSVMDRYISLASFAPGSDPEIYLIQNSDAIYFSADAISFIPSAERAVFRSSTEIYVCMQAKCSLTTDEPFQVTAGCTAIAASATMIGNNGLEFQINLEKPWQMGEVCIISKAGFKPFCVHYGVLFDTEAFESLFAYAGTDLGCTWSAGQTQFKVWSPMATTVSICFFQAADQDELERIESMVAEEKGTWAIRFSENMDGLYYTYRVMNGNETREVCDPMAVSVSVNGKRAYVLNPEKANPQGWSEIGHVIAKTPTDAVLYEVHVRDFSIHPDSGIANKGLFLGLAEEGTTTPDGTKTGLDHLAELGITHVHLMPIFDFYTIDESRTHESRFNWGYDPHLYNVPEGSYSSDPTDGMKRVQELKTAIAAMKRKGIGVVMDVVYNHTYRSIDSEFNKLVPGYYYRTDAFGRFMNGSGCGNETATRRYMVRKTIIESILFWAKEYKIDGFRFDLMGLHDIDTMNAIRRALDDHCPGLLLYGEGWTGGTSGLDHQNAALKSNAIRLMKIGFFNDNARDALKGDTFIEAAGGYLAGVVYMKEGVKQGIVGAIAHPQVDNMRAIGNISAWAGYPWHCVNYAASHDNLTLYDKLLACHAAASDTEAMKRTNLAGAFVLLSQGIPFMLSGTEFLRTKHGVHNSYNAPDAINQMEWERKSRYMSSFLYHKGLIALRKAHPAFRMVQPEEIRRNLQFLNTPDAVIAFQLKNYAGGDSWETILVAFNVGVTDVTIPLPVQKNWSFVVNEVMAGVDALGAFSGLSLTIPAVSVLVVHD